MKDNITIRTLEENDLESLVKLYRYFWNETSDLNQMKILFNKLKTQPQYIFLCAVTDDLVVGSIMGIVCYELYGQCRPFLVMEDLIVDQNYRRRGIGKALMSDLEKEAKKQGCCQILFITESNRGDAVAFYESLGFNLKKNRGFKKQL